MKKSIVIFLVVSPVITYSQQQEDIDLQQITDERFADPYQAGDPEELYENLVQILSSPIDLNSATEEDLRALHILSDTQTKNLLDYRKEQGHFLDIHELQTIEDFDLPLIERLLPFVCVVDPASRINRSLAQRILAPGHSYIVARYERTLEKRKGFKSATPAYQGSPDKLYFRYRNSQPGDYSFGLTGEKDAGERMVFSGSGHQLGFDFTSYHWQIQNKGILKNLILGDFQAQFGQGLVMGGAFGFGKGGESVSTTRKSNVGFRPFTSVQESAYHRGLAFTVVAFPHAEISACYSQVHRDASSDNDIASISSFQTSGYHRTTAELENRKQVTEENAGLILGIKKPGLQTGLIANMIRFDTPVKRTPTLYNQYSFRGSENINTGVYLNYTFQNLSFFGETARSLTGGWATLAGLMMNVHQNMEVVLLYRDYAKDYYVFFSNAFSENSNPQNERGFYWGWKHQWNRRVALNGYVDLFQFPWLGFRRYSPGHGYEWLLRAAYKPSRKASVSAQVRQESKPLNLNHDTQLYQIENIIRRTANFQCDYETDTGVRLKTRVQYNTFYDTKVTTEGWVVVQDVVFKYGSFKLTGRHAVFSADRYDNRHYVYENDAWGAYSFPAYTGNGVRNYVLFEYKVTKSITVWLRYARTAMSDTDQMGSGGDVIEGNTRNDVKFQARLKF